MSDGGRGRASLGVKVWKSSQMWSAQRSAVRSIAWLGHLDNALGKKANCCGYGAEQCANASDNSVFIVRKESADERQQKKGNQIRSKRSEGKQERPKEVFDGDGHARRVISPLVEK